MNAHRILRRALPILDRVVRVATSAALLAAYVNVGGAALAPTAAVAAPAALSVSTAVTGRPLLGGKATVRVTVKNTDTTNKAYNISATDVLSSSRPDPQGVVTFVSAKDGDGALVPTSVSTTGTTGDMTIKFVNIRDLAPQESYSFDMVVDLSGDPTWASGDFLQNAVTVGGNTIPNQTIPDIIASASASAKVVPIIIESKVAHQSTGVEQATGTGAARQYYYTIDIQNNYTGPTQSVVVTDTIPDGVEYLGMHGGSTPAPAVSRDASTGVTTLVWTLGTASMGLHKQLAYDTGIRYDYFGTNNGGKNRLDATALTTATAGQPIITAASAKKTFTNNVTLGASWLASATSDAATASVTGAALTVAKSSNRSEGGLGTVIDYTLTYATSQYYSAVATGGLTLVHDHIPDGQNFDATSSVPAPLSFLRNADGSTDVTWTVGAIGNTSGGQIKFSAVVGTTWEEPSYAGDPIVSGDSMVNHVDISGVASDNVNAARPNIPTTSADSVGFATHLPTINKQMLDPATHLWSHNVTMTVGDTSTVRVRFNTADGVSALRTDINMGNIDVTDWLPAGMSVLPGTFSVRNSGAGDFTLPTTGTPPPLNISVPTSETIGGVNGFSWYLGNVAPAGWWEATFDVQIDNVPAVQDGVIVANLWKLTGVNTFGTPYSARDMAMVNYQAPHLTLTKSVTPPSPLTGGSAVPYTLNISNTSSGTAYQGSITDTLPVGERGTAPVISSVKLDGTTLVAGTDYAAAWNASTGELTVKLQQGAIQTPLAGGSALQVNYTATLDPGVVANSSLTNTATIGYSTRPTPDGRVTSPTVNPADDNTDIATIHPDGLKIAKTGPSGPFTVGEVFGYDLDVTVPQHEIAYWPTVTDLLTHEGIVATGTPTITLQSGSPLVGASFASTATAPVRTTPAAGQTKLVFDLADPIDNTTSNQPYVFRIHFNVQYTGLKAGNAWEMQPPLTHDSFSDSASVAWNSVASAVRQTNSTANSGSVTTNLQQPLLKTLKTITSAGPYVGGSTIDYQLAISNVGSSTAFNPSIIDTLPAAAVNATITSLTLTGSTITTGANVSSWVATPTMRVGFDPTISIGTTQTLTIKYRVTLSPSLGAGVAIANAADANWNSLPGAPGGARVYNDSSQENWTQDAQAKSTNAAPATITKRGPAGPIRIGDTVTYSIDATVPANTVAWYPVFTDTLTQRGLNYVSNSATITTRANAPLIPADLGGASTPASTTSGVASATLTWTLPSAIDNSANSQPYGFTLSFQVKVTANNLGAWEYWPATPSQLITDTAGFKWRDVSTGGPAANHTIASNNTTTAITQPLIKATKTILTPGPQVDGAFVDYQVVLTNTGYNTAYDISVNDTMPVQMATATLQSATLSGVGSVLSSASSDFSSLPTSSVTFDPSVALSAGATLTLVYHCQLGLMVGSGAVMTNTVDANWSSMPGAVAGERVYNDSANETGAHIDAASVTTQAPLPTFAKSIDSGLTTATIGSLVPYTIEATIPANTTAYYLKMTDVVPDTLTVLDASPTVAAGPDWAPMITVDTPTGAGTTVTVNTMFYGVPALLPSPTPTHVAVTLLCQVRDTRYSGPAVVSGPVSNSASMQWQTSWIGGSVLTTTAGPVSFNVVQPNLTVTKTAAPTSAGPGDIVTFTSVVTNTGDSAAHAPNWMDVLPATMSDPTLLSVKHSSAGTLAEGVDYSLVTAGNAMAVALDTPGAPDIGPGQTVTIRFTGAVNGGVHNGTSMTDTATITSYSSLPTSTPPARSYGPVSATANVTALSPALTITKSVLSDAYPLQGTTARYKVVVKNVGTAPALAVVATDTLPADLTYVPGSTSASWPSAGSSSTADPTGGTGPTLAWKFGGTATLAAGQSLTLVFDAAIDANAPIGSRINTVTAAATDATGAPVPANCAAWIPGDTNPLDQATALIRIVKPGVAVAKVLSTSGDQFVQVGQKTGFQLTVTNTGDTTLTTVPLTDTYNPAELQYFSASQAPSTSGGGNVKWNSFGTIAPGASKSVNVTFTVLAQPASRVATNYVGVAGVVDEFTHTLGATQDAATVAVTRPAVAVAKTRHASQDATIQAGQAAIFDLVVTNTGDTTLTTVPLSDTFASANLVYTTATVAPSSTTSSSLTWANLGTLIPGASTTVTVTFAAVAAPVGHLTSDIARVNGAVDVNTDSPSNASDTSTIAISRPSVHVTKTLTSDPFIQVGGTATFKLLVTNNGDTTLTTIPVNDTWDAAALGAPVATPAGTYGAGTADWTLSGALAPGASTVVTLTLTALSVPTGQSTIDTATVSGTDLWADSAPGNSSSAMVSITHPAVGITKTLHAGQDPQVQVGQQVAYDITVTNTGDTTLLTIPVTDTYDSAALTYNTASLAANSVAGGVVTWNNTGVLVPGASTTIVATFTATAVPSGQISTDTAAVVSATDVHADHPADATAQASVRITAPGVAVVKTRALGQDGQIQAGEFATFDLAVTNTGNTTLATAPLTDTWDPAVFGFAGATAIPSSTGTGTATWTLTSLAPGATTTVTVTLLALASPASLTTTDTASVVATDVYGDPAGPSSSSATVMVTHPAVAVLKSLSAGQDPQIQVGQTVKFDLRVTNSGNTPLTTIPLSDMFDSSALTYTTATVAPTSATAGSLSWSDVGPLAVGATKVVTVTFTAVSVPAGQVTLDSLASAGTIDTYGDPTPDATSTGSIRITRPAVAVTKALHPGQDSAVQAGEPVAFDIVVTNTGDTTLTTVPLTDTYDAARLHYDSAAASADTSAAGTVHWNNLGTLAPGASATVLVHFTAVSNPAGQVTTNTVTVPSATDIYGDHPSDPTASAGVKVTRPAYTLTKTRVTDAAIQSSQTVTFDLTVHNSGDTTLTNVPLADAWDATYLTYFASDRSTTSLSLGFASWNLAPIAPGATSTVQVTLVALAAVPGLTTIDHAAVVGATDENGDPATDTTAQDSVDITAPSVAITKTLAAGQDARPQVGMPVDYTIVVTNSGDTTLTTVPVTDTFDAAHLSLAMASPAANSVAGNVVRWNNVGPLKVGQSATITIGFTAAATGGAIVNSAETSGTDSNGDPALPDTASDSTLRITGPGVSVQKTPVFGQDPQIQAGELATFDLLVTNTGDTTLTTVPLADSWNPAVFAFASASVSPDATSAARASWNNVGPLAPGQATLVTVTTIALSSPAGLVGDDVATVSPSTDEFGDNTPADASSSSVLVTRPGVTVTKARHASQDAVVQVGQSVAYDLTITNSGNTTLTSVPLADSFDPAALSFTSANVTPDATTPDGHLGWDNLGTLAPGASTTIVVTFDATSVPAGQVTTDTARVEDARDLYGDRAPDSAARADVRITHPDVAITKVPVAGQDAAIQAGEAATFTITVTNTGDTTLATVPLTDTYDEAVLALSSCTPECDSTSTNLLSWDNVGPLAPGESATVTVAFVAIKAAPGQVTTDTAAVDNATDVYGDRPANVDASAQVKVTRPSLALSKTLAPAQDLFIQTGQTVTFHLAVTNTGDTTLTAVPLADGWDSTYLQFSSASTLPQTSADGLATWTLGPIAPGATSSVDLTLIALGPVPAFDTTDTATVTGAVDENTDRPNDDASSAMISITKPMVAITKQLHAGQDTAVQVGQTVTYDIAVTNTGDVALAHIPLTDVFDSAVFSPTTANPAWDSAGVASVAWNDLGALPAGDTTTITVAFTAIGTSNRAGSVDTATVSGATDIHADVAPRVDATAEALVTKPEVTLLKGLSAGQATPVRLGSVVSYDLTVTNTGDTTLTTVPLTDTYDATQLEFVSAVASPTAATSGTLTWDNVAASPMAPGASVTVKARFRALVAGNEITNTGTSDGATDSHEDSTPPSASTDSSLSVYDPASLDVTKTANPVAGTILLPGQVITYTLAYNNRGGVTMPGVIASDPLPDSVTYVAGSLASGDTTLTDVIDADAGHYDAASRTVRVNLGDVGAETAGAVTFQVMVRPEQFSAKGVYNTAAFISQESTVATAGPIYHPVDPITIEKIGRDINGGNLKGGDVIEWKITVTNIGLTPTTHVVIHDTVPATTVYVKGSIRGKGANERARPSLTWDIGQMAVGETQVVTFRSTVKKGLPSGTLIKNQAVVTSDQSRPKKSDNPQTPTGGDATILVAKTSGSEDWRLPLGAGLLLVVAGLWLWPRRRRLAVDAISDTNSNQNAGGRNA